MFDFLLFLQSHFVEIVMFVFGASFVSAVAIFAAQPLIERILND